MWGKVLWEMARGRETRRTRATRWGPVRRPTIQENPLAEGAELGSWTGNSLEWPAPRGNLVSEVVRLEP